MESKSVSVTGGSGVTVVNTAEYIAGVTTTVTQNLARSAIQKDVKELVAGLAGEIAKLPPNVDANLIREMGDNTTRLSEELARPNPLRKFYELSLSGLKEAAEAVGAVAAPIVASTIQIAKLLGAAL